MVTDGGWNSEIPFFLYFIPRAKLWDVGTLECLDMMLCSSARAADASRGVNGMSV